jgi:hypothetical protein
MAVQAFWDRSGGFGPNELDEERRQVDPELAYEELLAHAWECRTCWPWRNQLWAVHRLCPKGAELADRYAVALGSKGEGQ